MLDFGHIHITYITYKDFNVVFSISLGWEESQLVRGWQNCSEVWGAFRCGAPATFVPGDHLRTLPLGELSHQRGQPGDRRLRALLQRGKQRRDEQPFDRPKLQTWIFRAGRRRYHCRWAEAVFSSGKWGDAEPSLRPWCHRLSSCSAHVPGSRLLTPPGLSSSRSYATSTSFASWVEPLGYFLRHKGNQEASCCDGRNVLSLRIYLRILYECLLYHFFPFFFSTCLSVFGVVCPKPKLTHDEC